MLPSVYEYFLIAAEEMNFTRAAERLHIAQQTLSQGIARLEEEYGVRLFDRKPKLTLTHAGRSLKKDLADLVLMDSQISKKMHDYQEGKQSELNIGIGMLRGQALMPTLLKKFSLRCPNCEVHILENESDSLLNDLLEGRTDLLIHTSELSSAECRSIRFAEEQINLVIHDRLLKSYCADHADKIVQVKNVSIPFPITYLNNCPFVLPDESSSLYKRLSVIFGSHFSPKIVATSKNQATLYRLASLGVGATFSTDTQISWLHSAYKNEEADLHIIPYSGFSPGRIVYISYPKNRYLSNAAKEFIRLILEVNHMSFPE